MWIETSTRPPQSMTATCNMGRKVYIESADSSTIDPCLEHLENEKQYVGKYELKYKKVLGVKIPLGYKRKHYPFWTYCGMRADEDPLTDFAWASPTAKHEYVAATSDGQNDWQNKKEQYQSTCSGNVNACPPLNRAECDLTHCSMPGKTNCRHKPRNLAAHLCLQTQSFFLTSAFAPMQS